MLTWINKKIGKIGISRKMNIGIEFLKIVGSAALLGAVIGYVVYSCREALKDLDAVINLQDFNNGKKRKR